jgi:type I restriction enzyme S subunit
MTAFSRVADLAEQIRGVTYAKDDATSNPRPGYLPVLRAGNITDDGLVFDDLVFVPAERIAPIQRIRRNDVVIAASSGSLDVVGKAARALADFDGGFGAFCKVLRPRSGIDPAYFAHFFRTREYRQRVSALAAGANINNLRNEHLDDFKIPLPPLPEQRRIAEILDKADALRSKRRVSLAQLDTLTQSIFLNMFGDPATNPKKWPKESLAELFDIARGGSPRPIDDYITDDPNGINWIMIGDAVEGGKYITATRKRIRPEGARRSRAVKTGDFLLTNSMSFGRPYIMRTSGCIHDGWLVLSPRRADVEPNYFFALLGSQAIYGEFARRAPGATVKNLNIDLVRGVSVPVPPLATQTQFAAIVAAIEDWAKPYNRSLSELDALFTSLQDRAFRGNL